MNQQNDIEEARSVCSYIQKRIPSDKGALALTDQSIITKTVSAIRDRNFVVFSALFGHNALLSWMEYLVEREEYESCAEIIAFIEKINRRKRKNKLPTRLGETINPS